MGVVNNESPAQYLEPSSMLEVSLNGLKKQLINVIINNY